MKLNDGYEVIRGSILVMSPLPAISHAYRLLLQEESHKRLYQPSTNTEDIMAFAVNNNRRGYQDKYKPPGFQNRQNFGQSDARGQNHGSNDTRGRNNYFCDHCKVPGHSIQRCYKIHGHPQHFKDKRIAANAYGENVDGESTISTGNDNNMGFTLAQYLQLLQLLGKEKIEEKGTNQIEAKSAHVAGKICLFSTGSTWIMDSGATDYMCYDLSLFSEYKQIEVLVITSLFQMANK